jgi:hypothetical protein
MINKKLILNFVIIKISNQKMEYLVLCEYKNHAPYCFCAFDEVNSDTLKTYRRLIEFVNKQSQKKINRKFHIFIVDKGNISTMENEHDILISNDELRIGTLKQNIQKINAFIKHKKIKLLKSCLSSPNLFEMLVPIYPF